MSERWLPVPSFEGFYEVSCAGNVRSVERSQTVLSRGGNSYTRIQPPKNLRPCLRSGYRTVYLWRNGVGGRRAISNLVALAFIGPRPPGNEVCHNNGVRTDDSVSNIRYDTHVGNQHDRRLHGTDIRGQDISWSKLRDNDVRFIRSKEHGLNQPQLAAKYGVTQSQISRVQLGKQWAHISC